MEKQEEINQKQDNIYYPGYKKPNIEVPEDMILVPVRKNPLKPQLRTGWELQPAPPKESDFIAPPELGKQSLLTKGELQDLLTEKSKQAGIYKSQPTGDKD